MGNAWEGRAIFDYRPMSLPDAGGNALAITIKDDEDIAMAATSGVTSARNCQWNRNQVIAK
ncbi:hypothetical protein [Thalassospira alkalitolerans]|uniref:hypothetical protein n=1 Tax=Thalassospira alkalitolerans TaxID=1293890 RepID=UPI003AA7AD9E